MQISNDVILTFIVRTHEILALDAQYFFNLFFCKTLTELDLQAYDAVVLVLACSHAISFHRRHNDQIRHRQLGCGQDRCR